MNDQLAIGTFLGLVGSYLIIVSIVGQFIPLKLSMPMGRVSTDSNTTIRSVTQRALLAIFGIVLAIPVIFLVYEEGFGRIWPLETGTLEMVAPVETTNAFGSDLLPGRGKFADYRTTMLRNFEEQPRFKLATSLIGTADLPTSFSPKVAELYAQEYRLVESFGLDQTTIRRLEYPRFQDNVYVYVGDIHNPKRRCFDVYVFTEDVGSWPSSGKIEAPEFLQRINEVSRKRILTVRERGNSIQFSYSGRIYRLTVTQIYIVLIGPNKIVVEISEYL